MNTFSLFTLDKLEALPRRPDDDDRFADIMPTPFFGVFEFFLDVPPPTDSDATVPLPST